MSRPSVPRRNRNLFAFGAIGLVIVARGLGVVQLSLAILLIVAIVWLMSWISKRENRSRFEAERQQWEAQNPNAERDAWMPLPVSPPRRSGWSNAGVVLAVIAAISGMAILATVVLVFVALATGDFSNK